jgi:hypothetical protein
MAKKKYVPPTPWEIAKPLLKKDILANTQVMAEMPPMKVILLRPEYGQVEYKNFVANLRNLCIMLTGLGNFANADDLVLQNDRLLHPINMVNLCMAYLCWDGHAAQCWLKIDIDNEAHLGVMPKSLWTTREEYRAFPLKVFCKHIHQEVSSRVETPYWLEYKAGKLRRAAAASSANNDDEAPNKS